MSTPEEPDIEARVSNLESEASRLKDGVSVSRADAAAARVLAGGADRDVSDVRAELRAHTRVLGALRETQIEQQGQLDELRSDLGRLDTKVDRLDGKVDQALGMLSTGMAQIVALLSIRGDDSTREDDESG